MFVYLDNSATTRQYDQVTKSMAETAADFYGNPSALHSLGLAAEKKVKEGRAGVAHAIGADESEIYFTSGGTESDNTSVYGIAKKSRRTGNKIITTRVEHSAVLEPCRALEKEGFEVVYLDVDKNCRPDMDQLRNEIDEKTILISVMGVNNEVGTIMPVEEIGSLKGNAAFHVDAVQALGKVKFSLKNIDLMSFSAHKIHGPKGIGALYMSSDMKMPAFISGGGQEKHMRSGTENVPGIMGFGLAAKMSADNFDKRIKSMSEARTYLLNGIRENISDIRVNSPEENCAQSVLNVSFLGTRGEVILHDLERDNIFVSTGSACSSHKKGGSHVLKAMGLSDREIEGALRFSFNEFNTIEEMDYVLDKLTAAVNRFRRLGSFR